MTQKATTWGSGYKLEVVAIGRLKANPWNPNKESDETFEKVKRSITNNGVVEPPQVREMDDGSLQIINGEHRWRAADALGHTDIPVINLGKISDQQAKKLTIITNELRGAPEPVLLAALIQDLSVDFTLEELALDLPLHAAEMESLQRSMAPFDWEATQAALPDHMQKTDPRTANLGGERRFQLGTAKGNVASKLADELMDEFNRSAIAIGSNNPELVLRDWLERLRLTADETDKRAPMVDTNTVTKRIKKAKAP